jgi:ABC-type oligopeptide transport system ATPase subunit
MSDLQFPLLHHWRVSRRPGPWLRLRGVSVDFDGPPVLEDISFSVAPGETRILLGPAGVGKSVLLKLIIGLLRPLEGSVELFGQDISHMPEEKLFPCGRAPAWSFRRALSSTRLTVRDNVAYQFIPGSVPDDEIDSACTMRCDSWASSRPSHSSFEPFRRHEAARRHRPRPHQPSGADPLRLAHRRPRSGDLHHHHRTHREAARRARNPGFAGDAPPSGRLHALHPPIR